MPWGGTGDEYIVESDPIQGDWSGEWISGPNGKASEIVAQVVARGDGTYMIRVLNYFDKRTAPYLVADARMKDGTLQFSKGDWSGTIANGKFTGQGSHREGSHGRFEMKKVIRLSPTLGMAPPPDAVVLFDGTGFENWESSRNASSIDWQLKPDDAMEIAVSADRKGHGLRTKKKFRDVTLHLEFRLPLMPAAGGQKRANSGLFIQGYEIQILDSYGLEGYENECGAFYKFKAPLVNMCAPPLQWQTYDVEYTSARFDEDGNVIAWPTFTVLHNGVIIHRNLEMDFEVVNKQGDRVRPPRDAQPVSLQFHASSIQFRNIWAIERNE